MNLDGGIEAWNRGAERMYGYTEVEARRMNVRDLASPQRLNETARMLQDLARGETTESYETQRRTKSGEVLDVWMTVTPQKDAAGRIRQIATTERDITPRKNAERQLGR